MGGARANAAEQAGWQSQRLDLGFHNSGSIASRKSKFYSRELTTVGISVVVCNGRVGSCPQGGRVEGRGVGYGLGGGTEPSGGKGNKGACRLRIGSWNIGTLTGKSIELAKILQKRKVNIACVQETRRVGSKARNADGFKLWYSRRMKGKNGVGILVDMELRE
nr:uncharacterized protein LOC104096931 [Nicotiana tomentosiformis]